MFVWNTLLIFLVIQYMKTKKLPESRQVYASEICGKCIHQGQAYSVNTLLGQKFTIIKLYNLGKNKRKYQNKCEQDVESSHLHISERKLGRQMKRSYSNKISLESLLNQVGFLLPNPQSAFPNLKYMDRVYFLSVSK